MRIFRAMFAHYSNLNFIDTGSYDLESVMSRTAEFATKLNLKQGIVPGTLKLITKAFLKEWDEDFLIVPPGMPIHINYGVSGILKTVEVAAGLALPQYASISVTK